MAKQQDGHFRCYVPKKFSEARLAEIERANEIVRDYEARGFDLTLRQLYYQLVARGLIPNEDREYKRLGALISDARLAGLVSWTAIEDRGRKLMGLTTVSGPAEAIHKTASDFKLDLWADQWVRPEVWVEKQALESVVGSICDRLRVDFFAQKGYNSQSAQWRAGQRFADYLRRGQRPVVFHLGDHDPSGLDMTRDNADRLSLFVGTPVQVVRLALNWDQIQRYNPPPNPAKESDSRSPEYMSKYGDKSWELDALDPATIHQLIDDAVARLRDEPKWEASLGREVQEREYLYNLAADLGFNTRQ